MGKCQADNSEKEFCQNCHQSANCLVPTINGGVCECMEGYGDFNGDGTYCYDIDECNNGLGNLCDENAICTNTDGGYECSCSKGFTGNGFQCFDIDECQDSIHHCATTHQCVNEIGSYKCSSGNGKTNVTYTKYYILNTWVFMSLAILLNY